MKKIIVVMLCVLILCSSQVAMAGEGGCLSYSFDLRPCNELTLSYSKGTGEFWSPLATGYYKYTTTDSEEIETILDALSSMEFTPEGESGWVGGAGFWIDVDGESVMDFLLEDGANLCHVYGETYFYPREQLREIEKLALDYKTKNDMKIYLDGEEIKFYNSPYITNGRTLVPARFMSEKMGIYASLYGTWSKNDGVVLQKYGKILTVCDDYVIEHRIIELPIDVGYQEADGLAMIPIRKVAEFFGYEVKWENNSVYIYSPSSIPRFSYAEDREMYAEGEPGVKTSGFVNTTATKITCENVVEHAKKECTVEYDTVEISYDDDELFWKVHFGKELSLGGDQTVYMDFNGKTLLVVYGE